MTIVSEETVHLHQAASVSQQPAGGLTPGERVVCCLAGGTLDRIPFGIGLGWRPWGETMARWQRESGLEKLNLARELGYDTGFALPRIEPGVFPLFPVQVLEEDANYRTMRDGRGITRRELKNSGNMPEFLACPVKTEADWERFKRERLDLATSGRISEDWPAFRARLAQTGEAVQVGVFPWGIFGTPRDFLGVENLLVDFCDRPELLHDMMDTLTSLWIGLWESVAAEVQIDHIHIWEDMSGRQGSLISPRMVEKFMMPCYDRIVAFARSHGVRVISVDSDGDVKQLVPIMRSHGINAFFPFEVQAGCDIERYRDQYPDLGLWGGLDKRALALGRSAIDVEVERCARMCERGRYLPMFDHLIPPDVPWADFVYAAGRIRRVCFGQSLG